MSSSDQTSAKEPQASSKPFQYHTVLNGEKTSGQESDALAPWELHESAGNRAAEQKEAAAFERGRQQGEAKTRAEFAKELKETQASIGEAIELFRTQREEYFARVEPEVVQLALAIARKILHREAQMDPLLLTGIVHVALEKLDAGTRIRLRAHPGDVHLWNQYFADPGGTQPAPELIGDPALKAGELCLETEVGSTQISLDTQLKEIEQGFFDLLEQRPRVR
jgi:flagellar assembly protein FliH